MAKEELNKVNEGTETGTEEIKATEIPVVAEDGKAKKILKWVVRGVALVATGIVGFVLGRTTSGGEEDSEESANDEESAA